jgi:hypothetical protein
MPRLYSRPPDQATVPPSQWLVWLTPPCRSIVVDEDVVHEHGRDGWRLVLIFAPGIASFGAAALGVPPGRLVWVVMFEVTSSGELGIVVFDATTGEFIFSGGLGAESWDRLVDLAP